MRQRVVNTWLVAGEGSEVAVTMTSEWLDVDHISSELAHQQTGEVPAIVGQIQYPVVRQHVSPLVSTYATAHLRTTAPRRSRTRTTTVRQWHACGSELSSRRTTPPAKTRCCSSARHIQKLGPRHPLRGV